MRMHQEFHQSAAAPCGAVEINRLFKKGGGCGGERDAVSLRSVCIPEVNNSSKISSRIWPPKNPPSENVDKFRWEREEKMLGSYLIRGQSGTRSSDRVEKGKKTLWVQLLLTFNSYLYPDLSSLTSLAASCPLMRICADTRRT